MINIIWILPILSLAWGILHCSIHLLLMYKEKIRIWEYQIIEKIGLWKTGVGRWVQLKRYSICYILSAILSVFISYIISHRTETGVMEQIPIFLKRLSTVELGKFFATAWFAMITVFVSLLINGYDFSKVDRSSFRLQFKRILCGSLPILIWVLTGLGVYKDYFFRSAYEWISSPGRVFQLCWGVVSACILVGAIFNNIRDAHKNL